VPMCEDDRLHLVEAVLEVLEVGEDEVDAWVVVLGEEHATVDDEQLAGVLDHRHVAAYFAEPPQRDDAHAVVGERRGFVEFGMGMAQCSPDWERPSRTTATWSGVASSRGSRTAAESMTPSSLSAALAMTAPWVTFMMALTAGTTCRCSSRARTRSPLSTQAT